MNKTKLTLYILTLMLPIIFADGILAQKQEKKEMGFAIVSEAIEAAQSSDVSLEDTVEYINKVLANNPTLVFKNTNIEGPEYRIDVTEEDSEIHVHHKTGDPPRRGVSEYYATTHIPSYLLADRSTVNSTCVQRGKITANCGKGSLILLTCKSGMNCIRVDGHSPPNDHEQIFTSVNNEQLDRLERAFQHLIAILNDEHNKKGTTPDDPFAH